MKAYVIAVETVKDEAMFADYRSKVLATFAPFGAQFLARGGALTILEGEWPHRRTVLIEFPSREAAEGWYRSDAYQAIIPLRQNSTDGTLVIVDGA